MRVQAGRQDFRGLAAIAIESGGPDAVHVRAKARICSALQVAHTASEVACGNLARLVDADYAADRLVDRGAV